MDDIFSKLLLAYILFAVGFVICVVAVFVCGHNAIVDYGAQRQYTQDCANAVTVKGSARGLGDCYVGTARADIVRQENVIVHQHAYLNKGNNNYAYMADITLPDGTTPECALSTAFGQAHLSYSGDCQVEVWKNAVTQLTVNGDTEETGDSPTVKLHRDLKNLGLSLVGAIAFAGLAWFFNRRDSNLRYN